MSDTSEKPITTDVVLSKALTPAAVFAPGKINEILSAIEGEVAKFQADPSTAEGREAIRAMAYKVTRSKTALDKMGKDLTEQWRASTSAVNAERKTVEARLGALAEKVRAPLTEYENLEKNRIAEHEAAILAITEWSPSEQGTSAEISERLAYLEVYPHRDWQEFGTRADRVLGDEITRTRDLLRTTKKREDDAAELAALREAQAAREREDAIRAQKEREARIAAEAAARATREAEERAAEERRRIEAEALAKAHAEAAERRRQEEEAKDRERRAAEALAQVERDKKEAEERLRAAEVRQAREAEERERQEIAREAARRDAAAQAEREAKEQREAAVQAERDRFAQEQAARDAEEAERAANKKHVAALVKQIVVDLVAAGATEKTALAIIVAIVGGKVRHTTIQY